MTSDEISIDAYMPGSNDIPTLFMTIFYRLVELRPTREQLIIMLRSNNVNIRCLALFFARVFVDYGDVYAILKTNFAENKVLFADQTIG